MQRRSGSITDTAGSFNEKVLRGRGVRLLEVLQAGERRSERDGCEDHRGQASRFHRGKSRWSDAEIEGIGSWFAQIENIIRQSLSIFLNHLLKTTSHLCYWCAF